MNYGIVNYYHFHPDIWFISPFIDNLMHDFSYLVDASVCISSNHHASDQNSQFAQQKYKR